MIQNEFLLEDAEKKVEEVYQKFIQACKEILQEAIYTQDRAETLCEQMIDYCIKSLTNLGKDFKYTVTCILSQSTGAGFQTAGIILSPQRVRDCQKEMA